MTSTYITTTIPYVNARPHLGFALELVQADVLARHHRQRGEQVRFQAGTDDNSLKNVLAAQAAGVGVQEFVDAQRRRVHRPGRAARPQRRRPDPHQQRPAAPAGSRAALAGLRRQRRPVPQALRGPVLRRLRAVLHGGGAGRRALPRARHGARPGVGGELVLPPVPLRRPAARRSSPAARSASSRPSAATRCWRSSTAGCEDFSVSRSTERARGWGIPVPGDPGQVIYVWWDALGNYLTALDYGDGGEDLRRWWTGASRRIHLLGKGVLRFHAVYWPAMLLSAGEAAAHRHRRPRLPHRERPQDQQVQRRPPSTRTTSSASTGRTRCAGGCCARCPGRGRRLHRRPPRRPGQRRARQRLRQPRQPGRRLVHRTAAGHVPVANGRALPGAQRLEQARVQAPKLIEAALAGGDFRQATAAVYAIASEANKYISQSEPWRLVKAERAGDAQASAQLDAVLAALIETCRELAGCLGPFLPEAAARIEAQCSPASCATAAGRLQRPAPVFTRSFRP